MYMEDDALDQVLGSIISPATGSITEERAGDRPTGDGLTPETIDALRAAQTRLLDERWNARLESLRKRAPFRGLAVAEQNRALNRLARIGRNQFGRRAPRPVRRDTPGSCGVDWQTIASLPAGGFAFGSADIPQVTPANDYSPGDNITGNSVAAVTFPASGMMGLGAAMGGWCDVVWEPTEDFFKLRGNRASAFLSKVFFVPNLAQRAPGALSASCTVTLLTPQIALIAGDPDPAGEAATMVWVCGEASIDLRVADGLRHASHTKSAVDNDTFFGISGIGEDATGLTNGLGGDWNTDTSTGGSPTLPVELTATISQPPSDSFLIYVSVSVALSAWSLPGIQSMALVDATGQNNGIPLLTAPGFISPYTDSTADNTAFRSGGVQVSNLQICGI